jgi:dienelactone hydrolase
MASCGALARPACRVEKLTYESGPGITVPALLFVPAQGAPRKLAVIFADARGKSAVAAEAKALATQGYMVLAARSGRLRRDTVGNREARFFFSSLRLL